MEALLNDDWRNIQDVVRQSFKVLYEIVRGQGDKIKMLEHKLKHATPCSNELESLQISMSNKPTFAEMEKQIAQHIDGINMKAMRNQLKSKADKSELKDLYSDVTHATKRIGENAVSLEQLVRLQQSEIDNLKRELNKMSNINKLQDGLHKNFAAKKWVEDSISNYNQSHRMSLESLKLQFEADVEKLRKSLESIPAISALDEVFSQKVDMNTLARALQDRPTLEQMRTEIEFQQEESSKYLSEQTKLSLEELADSIVLATKDQISQVEEDLLKKASRSELLELLGSKVSSTDLDHRLEITVDTMASEVKHGIIAIQKELVDCLNKKAFKADVQQMLKNKASVEDVQVWLGTKVEINDIRDALSYKVDLNNLTELKDRVGALEKISTPTSSGNVMSAKQIRKLFNEISSVQRKNSADTLGVYLDYSSDSSESNPSKEYEGFPWKAFVKGLKSVLAQKASVEEMCSLVDQKANIKDVNEALAQLENVPKASNMHDVGVLEKQVLKIQHEMVHLSQAMNQELSVSRWIWSSGRTRADKCVPWEVESINTSPDNFMWNKDTCVVTGIPGLYELSLGFFTDSDPVIQVLVNGEATFYSKQVNGSKNNRSFLRRGKHSAGNVTGWTLTEFVALPARARISVMYDGDAGAQGFLGLRKL